ncbi:MAG: winged helix-turn-helix transcriptional regulator [Acetobacteraceae bacterium]|nr:winged helix-turn-helix transcriptional regulator [Acetobacteraceae bacterium]
MFELGQYLPYLVNRAGVRLAVHFARDLKRHGIVLQEWRVLAALAAHGPQRLSDLAALTSIDLSTLSRLVGRMARVKLVERGRMNGDRREVQVKLTAKGSKTTRAIIPMARRYERTALGGFSDDETRLLKLLLVRLYSNLDGLRNGG